MKSPQRSSDDMEAGGDVPKSRNHSRRRGRGIFVAVDASIRFKSAMGCEKEIELGSHDQPTATDVALSQSEEQPVQVEIELPASYQDEFGIRLEELVSISRDGGLSVLKRFDGVSGLSPLLHTDLDKGICGSHEDIRRRRNTFGSNEYPLKKERNFWMFLWEASRSFTLIVLVLAALASLLLQIKTKTISHGWYDEAGIIVAVILVIFVTAISNYNQSLQFEKTHNLDTIAAELSPLLISLITEGIALNTNGSVYHPEGQSEPEVFGSATERAILNFGVKLGMNFDEIKSKSTIFSVSPFNSRRKRRGVAVQLHDSQVRVHWKGAAKTILASCQWYMDKDNIAAMDQERIFHFEKIIDEMSKEGLRCAALAYRTFTDEAFPDIPESNLVLLAIIGIKDSCRPGISRAIQQCRNAGVKVCMVTGDDLLTAKAIAMQCGILRGTLDEPANTAILASEFASMSEADREEIAENIVVMGRSSPDENLLLLEALRKKGHVVSATGKGIRDAPSLRQANISLAMGIGGTAIVKECSDIIILEDNFTSIVKVSEISRINVVDIIFENDCN
ncbi:hypothetical protein BRARA_A01596 [Brassica rapa]|uniref:Cation-transporting P-type ATPase N-terminal domain-containing protein n=1 Tax=Brassica campestris TaxID=3711 RepID=A0A398AM88_BRACM|nr:hypothetical protein BRARA_A01596 [Brassica rapa]